MPRYESGTFDPPAPVMRARVTGPGHLTQADVPLLLDTGADISIIPIAVAQNVEAKIEDGRVPVSYLGGEVATYDQARLTVEFGRYRFQGAFLLANVAYGVIGRNILNLLTVTFDGPGLTWSA